MATHSSVLAWRIPGMGEPGGLQSMGSRRVGHNWSTSLSLFTFLLQCMKVKSESEVAQSCPTLSNPVDCSLPGSSVHGIFQARVLEWVAIAFSEVIADSLHATPWTAADQARLSYIISLSLFRFTSIWLMILSNHFILCHPFIILPSIFPRIRVFPMSQFFTSGGKSIGASASA